MLGPNDPGTMRGVFKPLNNDNWAFGVVDISHLSKIRKLSPAFTLSVLLEK